MLPILLGPLVQFERLQTRSMLIPESVFQALVFLGVNSFLMTGTALR